MSMVASATDSSQPPHDEVGHVARGDLGRLVQRLGGRDGRHHLGRLHDGVRDGQVVAHVDSQGDAAGDLDAGAADLAVTHDGVQVAGSQQGAGCEDGQVDRRALADQTRVHVAAVRARRAAGHRQVRRAPRR